MNKRKNEILEDNVVISLDNIEKISKVIALASLRNFEKYAYSNSKRIDTLHKQLQKDICHHSELDPYSDAYDLVQEASLFLLKFVGKILALLLNLLQKLHKQYLLEWLVSKHCLHT